MARIRLADLDAIAEDLRRDGVNARRERVISQQFALEGLRIGEDFFPLWEINLPENVSAAESRDWNQIKNRRGASWSAHPGPGTDFGTSEFTGIVPLTAAENLFTVAKGLEQLYKVKVLPLPLSIVRKRDPTLTEQQFRSALALCKELDIEAVLGGTQRPTKTMLLVMFDLGQEFKNAEVKLYEAPPDPVGPFFRSLGLN